MLDYAADIQEFCRPGTQRLLDQYATRCDDEAVQKLKPLYEAENDELMPLLGIRAITGTLAASVTPAATRDYTVFLLSEVWSVRAKFGASRDGIPFLAPDYLDDLKTPYAQIRYNAPSGESRYPRIWFGCARTLGVDLREDLKERIVWDWSLAGGHLFSETWNHARYMASYDDAQALEGIGKALERQKDGNRLLSYLRDLVKLPVVSNGARGVLQTYQDDPRPTDGGIVEVPPIPLGVEVRALLARLG